MSTERFSIKIAYIGGGSRAWAPKLMSDLALSSRLDGEIVLYDTDMKAAQANVEVGEALFKHPDARTSFKVSAVERLEQALKGAQFVVISIEPGPITLRYADLEIPAKYGIYQTVGDTTGPGGILRALRVVPVYEDFAHSIMEHCPDAWVINYTNPMTVCTAALYAAEPEIKAFGCCHEVFSAQHRFAGLVSRWFDVPAPERSTIAIDIAGVNHFTFASAATWDGKDLIAKSRELIDEPAFFADRSEQAAGRKANEQWFTNDGLIAFDFLRRFGAFGAAGDRHLAEFVPWYLGSEANLHRWGIVMTPYEWRVRRMKDYSRRDPGAPLEPSGEEGVDQMEALLGIAPMITNVNIPNTGQVSGLPEGAVVESYAHFERDSLKPIVSGPLPRPLMSHIRSISDIQGMTLEAGRTRNRELALDVLLLDPLVRIPTDKVDAMFGEMVEYVKDYLPGW